MIASKNPIRDITAYLNNVEVENLPKVPFLETTIFEEGRKRMSHKRFKIGLNGHDKIDLYAGKEKDEKNTLYRVSLSSQYYAHYKKEGEMQVFIQDPLDSSKNNQLVRIKTVEKINHSEQSKYYRLKNAIDRITGSRSPVFNYRTLDHKSVL